VCGSSPDVPGPDVPALPALLDVAGAAHFFALRMPRELRLGTLRLHAVQQREVDARAAGGTRWASADDWAALLASGVIAFNGISMLRSAMHDLMDRMADATVVEPVRRAALAVPGVLAVEKLYLRKVGLTYRTTIHVQAEPAISLRDAHALGGQVKRAIQSAVPQVASVLVHMEPFEPRGQSAVSP